MSKFVITRAWPAEVLSLATLVADFCNKICQKPTSSPAVNIAGRRPLRADGPLLLDTLLRRT